MSNSRKRNLARKQEYDRAYQAKNREKYRNHAKKSNAKKTKDQQKESFIKSKYGITLKEFEEMLKMQGNVCAICFKPESRKNKYTGICRLHIDHDHKTGKVRGLLCSKCNFGIAAFSDSEEMLMSAIAYLTQNK